MGFKHEQAEVAAIEVATGDAIKKYQQGNHKPDSPPSYRLINGLPVHPYLYKLCVEVQKQHPAVKFGVNSCNWGWVGAVIFYRELWVYFPDDVMARMKIGYGNYAIGASTDEVYMVYARTVANKKIKPRMDQHHMLQTGDLKSAVKNVNKCMRPYSPAEAANVFAREFISEAKSSTGTAASTLVTAWEQITTDLSGRVLLKNELKKLMQDGYAFTSDDLRERVAQWINAEGVYAEKKSRTIHAWYIRVYTDSIGEQMAEMTELRDLQRADFNIKINPDIPVVRMRTADLPASIPPKVATLSMMGDKEYVEGVGMRINGTTFWIEQD